MNLAKPILSFILSLGLLTLNQTVYAFDHEHQAWDKLLKTYLTADHRVAYQRWQKNQDELNAYLNQLESVAYKTYQSWSPHQRKAFLINAYNAFTIKLILKHYPVDSIKDIGGLFSGPWSQDFFTLLGGRIESLDPIEHEWLRAKPELKDPRVHAVVNCASVSCPVLRREAYVASRLDEQMDDAVESWLRDPKRNQFNPGKKVARLSKIFDWYDADFGGNKAGIAAFVKKFGPESARKTLTDSATIEFLEYNWQLNEVKEPKKKAKG
jgi:hypothetical protein